MLGQVVIGRTGNTGSGSRFFQYEVAGLRKSYDTDKVGYPIRSSASIFITVPYSRMNEEMQRISRMGGKIVGIKPFPSGAEAGGSTAVGAGLASAESSTAAEGNPSAESSTVAEDRQQRGTASADYRESNPPSSSES
jgi:hypothetical protein